MRFCLPATLLLVTASIASCKREAPTAPSRETPKPPSSSAIEQQAQEALRQLSNVRGLVPNRDIPIRVVDSAEYRRQLVQRVATLVSNNNAALPSLWVSLNFADGTANALEIAERVVDDAQVDAFYDPSTGAVVVRQPKTATYDARESIAVVMALENALQEQHFGPAPAGIGLDVDKNLAQLALREGDAAAANMAYFASRHGKPAVDAVTRAAVLLDSLPVDALITGVGYAAALANAPLLVRDELSRARPAGLQLVAALLRAKDFRLVDRALSSPPTSMLAMYDPALYAHGWQPMTFPAAASSAPSGTLGVVGLLAFVERCQPTQHAKLFVADWRGDSYSLTSKGKDGPVIVWRTAWKDDAAARRFADEVTGAAQCRAPATSTAVHFEALRRGAVVALSNSTDAKLLIQAASVRPRVTPASAPPLGDPNISLTPAVGPRYAGRATIDVRRSGKVNGSSYTNDRLGFTAVIPAGVEVSTDEILAIDHPPPSLASGRVTFEQSAAPFTNPQDFFAGLKDRISRTFFRGAPLSEVTDGQEQTPFGRAPYRVYEMRAGRPANIRVVALPICKGAAALIVSMVFMDDAGAGMLNTWLRSFRPMANAPICSALATTAP